MNALRVRYTPARSHVVEARMTSLEEAREPLDRGAQGPASLARERRIVEVDVKARGSTQAGEVITAARIVCECTIDTLHAQRHLDPDQWRAGTWFRRRYLLGYGTPSMTANYTATIVGGNRDETSARVLDARADLAALAGVLSLMQWASVEAVAGCDQSAKGRLPHLKAGLDLVTAWLKVQNGA